MNWYLISECFCLCYLLALNACVKLLKMNEIIVITSIVVNVQWSMHRKSNNQNHIRLSRRSSSAVAFISFTIDFIIQTKEMNTNRQSKRDEKNSYRNEQKDRKQKIE